MTSEQQQKQERRRTRSGKRAAASLLTHGGFAPLLGLWGAALGGLTVMVLPGWMIAALTTRAGLVPWAAWAQPVLALAAGLGLGAAMFALAALISRSARRRAGAPSIAEVAARRMRPIDPVRDLGSNSLDDPLETVPFAAPGWREGAEQSGAAPQPEPAPAPRMLDLSEFAELPGRNAVWVEDLPPTPQPAPQSAPQAASEPVAYAPVSPLRAPAAAAAAADPSAAALARLRAVPPSQLSLAEMAERFAGALHDHRSGAPGKTLSPHDLAAREAALAEALKALTALSRDSAAPVQSEPLRAALARLQGLRGAA